MSTLLGLFNAEGIFFFFRAIIEFQVNNNYSYDFNYSYQIQIIYTQFYGFKYSLSNSNNFMV